MPELPGRPKAWHRAQQSQLGAAGSARLRSWQLRGPQGVKLKAWKMLGINGGFYGFIMIYLGINGDYWGILDSMDLSEGFYGFIWDLL